MLNITFIHDFLCWILTFHGFFLYHFLLLSTNLKWEGGKFFLIYSADKTQACFSIAGSVFFFQNAKTQRVQCLGLGMELSFSLEIKLQSYELSCKFGVCRLSMIAEISPRLQIPNLLIILANQSSKTNKRDWWVRACNNGVTCLHLTHSAPDLFWSLQTRLIKRSSSGWLRSLFIFYCDDSGNKYHSCSNSTFSLCCVFSDSKEHGNQWQHTSLKICHKKLVLRQYHPRMKKWECKLRHHSLGFQPAHFSGSSLGIQIYSKQIQHCFPPLL